MRQTPHVFNIQGGTKMSQLTILGQCEVNGGQKGDPKRAAKIVGSRPHLLGNGGLEPDRFPELDTWPEGQRHLELAVANYPGEYFRDFSKAQARLKGDPELANWQPGGFPKLMSDGVWNNLQMLWECGIWRVYAPAPEAVWLSSDGDRYAPYVSCRPGARHLRAAHGCLILLR
ncbi:MAG: hypothetical protein UT11_C0017G0020 [Berkelbacteria bacterium GW2011_GWA2_38_9]|uniref:Uncharacterized protein n=1 Tax=Berkelbacteria bacterium GW2011_GWA2_38_9 TaxID=1618334 RepID=A0A0G0LFP4_9BACT|nr:MAG: hypothetical protein UT11_C0017G0020 [Berkelbacteria bacterium GW2011_GWA2_38_9]